MYSIDPILTKSFTIQLGKIFVCYLSELRVGRFQIISELHLTGMDMEIPR
jgi:hypothetical protein